VRFFVFVARESSPPHPLWVVNKNDIERNTSTFTFFVNLFEYSYVNLYNVSMTEQNDDTGVQKEASGNLDQTLRH